LGLRVLPMEDTLSDDSVAFVTLSMFIIDEFSFLDEQGHTTGRSFPPQIGGGAYTAIGARIWLPSNHLGMIVDRGPDFPVDIERRLLEYGSEMWMFRYQPDHRTTRALNSFRGEQRTFEYKTPRIRLTPADLEGTKLAKPKMLHFVCSPSRALSIISEFNATWEPVTIYEPIPICCVPDELDELISVLRSISIFSPNAEEALSLLSLPLPPSKELIELATDKFLEVGVGRNKAGWVIIRCGALGSYMKSEMKEGMWFQAYWTAQDGVKIVDVTGAGNSFLGGLAAGMLITGDMYQATLYATVSASFIIEQEGLPAVTYTPTEEWNGDQPFRRLEALRKRHENTAN